MHKTDVEIHVNSNAMGRDLTQSQIEAYLDLLLIAHLRGRHPYGSMQRECPLCNQITKTLGTERIPT